MALTKIRNLAIISKDRLQAKNIQLKAFDMGYRWSSDKGVKTPIPRYLNSKAFFLWKQDGCICYSDNTYSLGIQQNNDIVISFEDFMENNFDPIFFRNKKRKQKLYGIY